MDHGLYVTGPDKLTSIESDWLGGAEVDIVVPTYSASFHSIDGITWDDSTQDDLDSLEQYFGSGTNRTIAPIYWMGDNRNDYASVVAGDHDADFRGFAQDLIDRGMDDAIIRPNAEFNLDWSSAYPSDPQEYADSFAILVREMQSVSGSNFEFMFSPAANQIGVADECWPVTESALWPSGEPEPYVAPSKYDSWGGYTDCSTLTDSDRQNSWDQSHFDEVQQWVDFANQRNAPTGWPEWGLGPCDGSWHPAGGDNPFFINDMRNFMESTGAAFENYWNAENNSHSVYDPELYPRGADALKSWWQDDILASASQENGRTLSTVTPSAFGSAGATETASFATTASPSAVETSAAGDNWYNSNWNKRRKLTISATEIPADVSSLTVLTMGRVMTDGAEQASGDDVLFTRANGVTKLSHQLGGIDDSDRVYAAVNITVSGSSDTDLYMYWDNSGASNQEDVSGAWPNHSHVLAFTRDEAAAGSTTVTDALGVSDYDLDVGAPTWSIAPDQPLGGSLEFDGQDDAITSQSAVGTAQIGTVELRLFTDQIYSGSYAARPWGMHDGFEMAWDGSDINADIQVEGTAGYASNFNWVADEWHDIAFRFDPNSQGFDWFVDGTITASGATSALNGNTYSSTNYIGDSRGQANYTEQHISFFAISDAYLGTVRLEARTNNLSSPDAFWSEGAVELEGGGVPETGSVTASASVNATEFVGSFTESGRATVRAAPSAAVGTGADTIYGDDVYGGTTYENPSVSGETASASETSIARATATADVAESVIINITEPFDDGRATTVATVSLLSATTESTYGAETYGSSTYESPVFTGETTSASDSATTPVSVTPAVADEVPVTESPGAISITTSIDFANETAPIFERDAEVPISTTVSITSQPVTVTESGRATASATVSMVEQDVAITETPTTAADVTVSGLESNIQVSESVALTFGVSPSVVRTSVSASESLSIGVTATVAVPAAVGRVSDAGTTTAQASPTVTTETTVADGTATVVVDATPSVDAVAIATETPAIQPALSIAATESIIVPINESASVVVDVTPSADELVAIEATPSVAITATPSAVDQVIVDESPAVAIDVTPDAIATAPATESVTSTAGVTIAPITETATVTAEPHIGAVAAVSAIDTATATDTPSVAVAVTLDATATVLLPVLESAAVGVTATPAVAETVIIPTFETGAAEVVAIPDASASGVATDGGSTAAKAAPAAVEIAYAPAGTRASKVGRTDLASVGTRRFTLDLTVGDE